MVKTLESEGRPYNYVPTEFVCIVFIVVFSLTTLVHLVQARLSRNWYWIPTFVLCGIGEIIGWSGRLWGSQNPANMTSYLLQISTLILSPAFMVGVIFALHPKLAQQLGPQYSTLTAQYYEKYFTLFDCLALAAQAVGGGLAATTNYRNGRRRGAYIMLGGIVLQLVTFAIFLLFYIELLLRFHFDKPLRQGRSESGGMGGQSQEELYLKHGIHYTQPVLFMQCRPTRWRELDPGLRRMVIGLSFVLCLILVRSVYRTTELIHGWDGRIISTEWYFNCFDGAPIALSLLTLNWFHPARLLTDTCDTKQSNDGLFQ